MSFLILPSELQGETFAYLPGEALATVCLVSKATLALARPILYRSLPLDFPFKATSHSTLDANEHWEEEEYEERKRWQAKLCETLEAHPEWCSYVRRLKIYLSTSMGTTSTAPHLSNFTSLKQLEVLEAEAGFDRSTCDFFIPHCPPTVTSLEICQSNLPSWAVYNLLQRLPLLETLSLGLRDDSAMSRPPGTSLVLAHLHTLYLHGTSQNTSTFVAVQEAAPHLSELQVDYLTVQALDPAHLSAISQFTIWVDVYPRAQIDPTMRPVEYFEDFVSVLAGCTSLRTFELWNLFPSMNQEDVEQLESHRILHHLPRSLGRLKLSSVYFTPSYLLDFLSSHADSLRILVLSSIVIPSIEGIDDEAEAEVDEICDSRVLSV
ncbi:hypothetical protein JCM16303_006157 [Sporobolomyces ruberrimus]